MSWTGRHCISAVAYRGCSRNLFVGCAAIAARNLSSSHALADMAMETQLPASPPVRSSQLQVLPESCQNSTDPVVLSLHHPRRFNDAAAIEPYCVEAIYNLGLASVRLRELPYAGDRACRACLAHNRGSEGLSYLATIAMPS